MTPKIIFLVCYFIITNIGLTNTNNSKKIDIKTVPVDTLLSKNISFQKKVFIGLIKKWQKYSYAKDHLNCQFYPSCSNYVASSIKQHNIFWGIIKGFDRILRCNPYAIDHFKHKRFEPKYHDDGRMIDHINPKYNFKPSKNPKLALALSCVPGLGRVYCERYIDGALSFYLISLFSLITKNQYSKNNKPLFVLSGAITTSLWISEFYGSYRTAKIFY